MIRFVGNCNLGFALQKFFPGNGILVGFWGKVVFWGREKFVPVLLLPLKLFAIVVRINIIESFARKEKSLQTNSKKI